MATVTSVGSGNYNTGSTWDSGARPGSSDDVVIASGHTVTLVQAENANSLDLQSGGTLDGDGNLLTIDGENSSGFAVNLDGAISGTDTDITITTPAATNIDLKATSGNVRNVTINHASCAAAIAGGFMTITGNLTITAGSLNTGGNDLTVAGTTTVTGTLTCNASTVSLGSGYTGGYALLGNGTVNFGTGTNTVGAINTHSPSGITKTSGTITFDTQKTGSQSIGPTVTSNNTHFDFGTSTVNFDLSGGAGVKFAIEQHTGSSKTLTITAATVNYKSDGYIYQNNTDTNIFKIIGDLVIDASKTLETYYDNADDFGSKLQVTGDVTLNGTLNAYSASNPKPMDFGSLTIGGSGTYKATSGTTTITSNTATGTRSVYNNGGTFTHNNGTLKINTSANTNYDFDGDDLFNFTVECENGSGALTCDGEASTAVTVLNNLDIKMGILRTNANSFTIHGNVFVRETSKTNKNKFVAQGANQTVKGLITVEDGAFFDMQNQGSGSFGTLTTGGIRVL